MFEKLPMPPGVLGYRFAGEVTRSDVDEIYDELRPALDKHDKVSVFVEIVGDFDMTGRAAWRDLSRAPELLGHYRQFDRIALVTKPSWIQRVAKLEESFLAFFDFNMHVFDPEQREYALAWVKGEVEESDAPSIRELPSDDPDIAIFEIDGKIRKQDLAVSKQILEKFQTDEQPRKLVGVIKHFAGFELAILGDSQLFKMKFEAAKHLDRYAFVGAPSWLEGYIEAIGPLFKPDMRTFDADELDEALAWLKEDQLVA